MTIEKTLDESLKHLNRHNTGGFLWYRLYHKPGIANNLQDPHFTPEAEKETRLFNQLDSLLIPKEDWMLIVKYLIDDNYIEEDPTKNKPSDEPKRIRITFKGRAFISQGGY